ncbi:MAG: BtpA/SgcQ family protein [Candidatus Njordarchaeales archaeon]
MNLIPSFDEIFGEETPVIIGVIHLKPLPGSPLYDGNMDKIMSNAIKDAKALEDGGVDGIIVENFGDRPYLKRVEDPETLVAMAVIVKEVIREVSVPVGVNVLRNSAEESLAIAYVTGGRFIRVNAYVETIVSDSGIIEPAAPKVLRKAKSLDAKIGILADVHVKHAKPLGERELEEVIIDAFERGLATAVIITGPRTGEPPREEFLRRAKYINKGPILIGSGLRPDNIKLLKYADGAIVGSYFKKKDIFSPVDRERVRRLVELAKKYSKNK